MARLFRGYEDALARTIEIAERCRFSLEELQYDYPDESGGDGSTPQARLESLAWNGAAWRYPEGVPDEVTERIETELRLIDKLGYAPYFLTVNSIVKEARRRENSVPGARLGGQFGGVLLPRRHRGRSRKDRRAVRALHQRGTQRAARHRRRFRA